MLEVAKQRNLRDYLIYKLMAARGFRIGEVLGTPSRKREGKKWIRLNEPTNPGLMVKDLTNEGVWVRKKDKPAQLRPLESEDVLELRELIGKRRSGRVFPPVSPR